MAIDYYYCLSLCQSRLHSLETEVEQGRRFSLQLELLKKEKARLLSQLTAQESVIDGLRAERRIWGQELAQQGGRHQLHFELVLQYTTHVDDQL